MKLNITLKILAFCIPSFQSSWHFAFYGELNTPFDTLLKLQFFSDGVQIKSVFGRIKPTTLETCHHGRKPLSLPEFRPAEDSRH